MDFEIKILLITFAISVICGIITIPILKKLKIGQIERDDGPASHLKKQGTPTMGGIIMIVAIIIATVGACIFFSVTNNQELIKRLIPLLIITIAFGMIGFIDDFKKLVLKNTDGLKPKYKMLGLLIIAVIYVLFLVYGLKMGTETYIPIIKTYINIPIYLYIPLAILVILATTNAVNLTDGLDGLAAGLSAIAIMVYGMIAWNSGWLAGYDDIAVFCFILVGGLLGFLVYNGHPAKVFMGDTGSLALGAVLATLAILTHREMSLIVVGGVFVIETLSVILQVASVKIRGKKLFPMTPIHHTFEKLGWSETDIVRLFYVVGFILGTGALVYGVWY